MDCYIFRAYYKSMKAISNANCTDSVSFFCATTANRSLLALSSKPNQRLRSLPVVRTTDVTSRSPSCRAILLSLEKPFHCLSLMGWLCFRSSKSVKHSSSPALPEDHCHGEAPDPELRYSVKSSNTKCQTRGLLESIPHLPFRTHHRRSSESSWSRNASEEFPSPYHLSQTSSRGSMMSDDAKGQPLHPLPLPKPSQEYDKPSPSLSASGVTSRLTQSSKQGQGQTIREDLQAGDNNQPKSLKLKQSLSRPRPQSVQKKNGCSARQNRWSPPQTECSQEPHLPRGESQRTGLLTPPEGCLAAELYKRNANKQTSVRSFSYNELRNATNNFSEDLILGIGGFGTVYKGVVKSISPQVKTDFKGGSQASRQQSMEVAIKKLDSQSLQGHKEWMMEVSMLGLLEHPHLVKLIGFCTDQDRRLLVYEYLANTSLDRFVFGTDKPLNLSMRLQIVLEAAKGLAYLHEEVEPQVIYRDFKTTNILLDADFHAKLSDFGLAREGPRGEDTHVSTQVRGTAGYAAPEYILTGHLTPKNDVWSFGVVLLELLTGRPSLDRDRPAREHNLVQLCRPYLLAPSKFHKIIDPHLRGEVSQKVSQKAAELSKWCLAPDHSCRPTMSEVVIMLDSIKTLHENQIG